MSLHKSDYLISVYIEDINKYFCIHGYSGAMTFLSIDIMEILNKNKINELSDDEKKALESIHFITSKSKREEIEMVKQAFDKFLEIQNKNIKGAHFLIIFSYDCNFRCVYCYEKNLINFGKKWLQKRMNEETLIKCINTMKKISKIYKNNSITFYGGEPFMKENYKIVSLAIKKLKEQGYNDIFIVTNGYDLDYYKEFLGDSVKSLQITLDGPKKVHDKMRIHYKGESTFDKIISNIEMALSKGVNVSLRGNVNEKNLKESENLYKYLKEKGFTSNNNFYYYISAITDIEMKDNENTKMNNFIVEKIIKNEFNEKINTSYFHKDLEEKLLQCITNRIPYPFKISSCAATNNMYIFDPFGDIYTCWDLVGQKKYSIGTFYPKFNFNNNKGFWQKRKVNEIECCLKCPYILFCGAGCSANALRANGTIYSGDCQNLPEAFEEIAKRAISKYLKQTKEHINKI